MGAHKCIVYTGASLIGNIMPTKLRRITLSLPPELDEALARFGRVSHGSQSKFVVECLEQSIPVINGICDAIEAAKNGDSEQASDILLEQVDTVDTVISELREK